MASQRLTAAEVAEQVALRSGVGVEQVRAVLKAQAELAYEHAGRGFPVLGIGVFSTVESPERKMVMRFGPEVGREISIPGSKKLKFRLSRVAKEMVLGRARAMPDLFEPEGVPEFKFSTESTELSDPSMFVGQLGGPLDVAVDGSPVALVVRRLPDLWLPSGKILAAEGFGVRGRPFGCSVAPGRYPLALAIARLGTDERVAFAIVRFSDARVVKWEMAEPEGRDLSSLKEGQFFGYGVDSGTGSICDASVQQLVEEAEDADLGFFDRAAEEMKGVYKSTRQWVHVETGNGSLAMFSSGFGDGHYASYFGLDGAGNAAMLVTDFKVVKSRFSE